MSERITFTATAKVEGNTLSGVAHTFGQRTYRDGKWIEFASGSFDAALRNSDVRAFMNHNTDKLLGRQSAGTLRVEAKPDGLHYSIDLPDTSYAHDLKVLVDRGDLSEMSFGVIPGETKTARAADGKKVVIHTSVKDIFDISPVSLPAFSGTSAVLHSALEGESLKSQAVKARHRAQFPQE